MHTLELDSLPLPCILVHKDETIVSFNQVLERCLNFRINTGVRISDIFNKWERNFDSNFITAKYKDQFFVFLNGVLSKNNYQLYIGIKAPKIDKLINEHKELTKINRELDAIIENSYDGIYITDSNGITLKTNDAIERITGIPKEYYIGKSVENLMKRGILKNSVTTQVLKKRGTISLVQKNYAGNETLLTGTPVFNEDGEIEKVVTNIRDLSDLYKLQAELNELKDKYKEEMDRLKSASNNDLIVKDSKMKVLYETADRINDIDATVLILGETGVGKDVYAKYIYENSKRANVGEFIKINCGAIPPDLLESELFGYESGAFTGADRKGKPGMFELAHKGILFLDEIGELPYVLQVKLLRVLQDGEIQRVGGTKTKKVDVRIIAATNKSLKDMVAKGDFREDLYYRLHVIPIHIPPLRDRHDDILLLIDVVLRKFNDKYQLKKQFDYDLKEFFLSYEWPGNIRELSNLIERLAVTTRKDLITTENLPIEYQNSTNVIVQSNFTLKEAIEQAEERMLRLAFEKYSNTYEMAKALDTSQPTIVRKLKKYSIRKKDSK